MTWMERAQCLGQEPELWFPCTRKETRAAKSLCVGCPVIWECLQAALREEQGKSVKSRHGVRGGLTPEERAHAVVFGDLRGREVHTPGWAQAGSSAPERDVHVG